MEGLALGRFEGERHGLAGLAAFQFHLAWVQDADLDVVLRAVAFVTLEREFPVPILEEMRGEIAFHAHPDFVSGNLRRGREGLVTQLDYAHLIVLEFLGRLAERSGEDRISDSRHPPGTREAGTAGNADRLRMILD